ncbi:MAG: arylsulfotransferase family protein [Solirubrobacteraceae bacterium]
MPATAAAIFLALGSASPAATPTVHTFPIPGGQVASPETQISFRGIPVTPLSVVGSESGPHSGRVMRHSDGHGSSFLPKVAFTPGEVVTVRTPSTVNVAESKNGVFDFKVATPASQATCVKYPVAPRIRGSVWRFHSRPDLDPAAVKVVTTSKRMAPGDIFVGPGNGPVQTGPMILDPAGRLIWFRPLRGDNWASDFTTQVYLGQSVLTWWQGCNNGGGVDEIYNSHYRRVAAVRAGNGLRADLHEFKITRQGTALITSYYPVIWPVQTPHGKVRQVVVDGVVQEIDIRSCHVGPTCLVLFQWDSLDHVPVRDVHAQRPAKAGDYFHVNSVQQDSDGNLVINSRNTWAAYKVSHDTGRIMWTLGGKHSSFKFGPGAAFAFQHDVRVFAHDTLVTMFDDEGGPPAVGSQSRGLKLRLDLKTMTATLVSQYVHDPALQAFYMGGVQTLPDSHVFVGWGPQGHFSEFDRHGQLLFDARFVGPDSSYRAFRFPWIGIPATFPSVTASDTDNGTQVYASWNGATEVAAWQVLAGSTPTSLTARGVFSKSDFETAMAISRVRYVAVQALDSANRVIGRSPTIQAG